MSTSTVFTTNHSQAVRLPADMHLPDSVKKVEVRVVALERIIAPSQNPLGTVFFWLSKQ